LIPHGEAYVAPKTMLNRHGLLVNENKKAEFSSTESVRLLNRLLRFKKGQQENAAALPEVSLDHSMAALAALIKHLDVTYLHIIILNYLQLTTETFSIANGRRNKLWAVQSTKL
jgi:hypothetical protein